MKVHVLYLGVNCSCLFACKVLGGSSGLNKSRMVPPFLLHMIHIGKIIEEEFYRQGRSVSWFANKLCCDRTNVYNIFKRESIDTALLAKISRTLGHDFFSYYVDDLKRV